MKLSVTKYSYEARDYDFKGITLKIRPYPNSMSDLIIKDGAVTVSGAEAWKQFNYCLTGWDDLVGDDDQPLPCNESVKKAIFDFDIENIPAFVLIKSKEHAAGVEGLEKNS